ERLTFLTPSTVKLSAMATATSLPSRDFTVKVLPSTFATLPRTLVSVPSGVCATVGRASSAASAATASDMDLMALHSLLGRRAQSRVARAYHATRAGARRALLTSS